MDSITSQVRSLADNADEAERRSIQNALRELLLEFQSPMDIIYQLLNSPVQLTVVRLGIEMKLFETLANSDSSFTVSSLAEQLKVDHSLLGRVLRYLASNDFVKETGFEEFAAAPITKILADKGIDAITSHGFYLVGPILQAAPSFLSETNYQEISIKTKTPFQKAFHTELSVFEWMVQHPNYTRNGQLAMASTQSSDWLQDFQLLEEAVHDFTSCPEPLSNRPFFVDVGGSYGHQTVHLRDKYSGLSGHLVLQDMLEVVEQVPALDGIKVMAQDFFTPQVVQGSRFYYLRRVLHDWPDDQCVKILQNIAAAMESSSRILIDEAVLPDANVSSQAAMGDLLMMIMSAGKERSEKQFKSLGNSAGLRVAHVHAYDLLSHHAVLVLERL